MLAVTFHDPLGAGNGLFGTILTPQSGSVSGLLVLTTSLYPWVQRPLEGRASLEIRPANK